MRARRVKLRVRNVPLLAEYHGRDAGVIGQTVEAVEITSRDAVAYVDDRDGRASELVRLVVADAEGAREELMDHAKRRFLDGEVRGVLT